MIGQQIGLVHLVPLAIQRLYSDPLASGDMFAGDLLKSVVRIDPRFWMRQPGLAAQLRGITTNLLADPDRVAELDPHTRDDIIEGRRQLAVEIAGTRSPDR